jgi:hypothetical protein
MSFINNLRRKARILEIPGMSQRLDEIFESVLYHGAHATHAQAEIQAIVDHVLEVEDARTKPLTEEQLMLRYPELVLE